jgi:hypothetical protein
VPDTAEQQQWSRDEAVAKLLSGAVAAAYLDGAKPGTIDLIAGTAEVRFGDQTYVTTITAKP